MALWLYLSFFKRFWAICLIFSCSENYISKFVYKQDIFQNYFLIDKHGKLPRLRRHLRALGWWTDWCFEEFGKFGRTKSSTLSCHCGSNQRYKLTMSLSDNAPNYLPSWVRYAKENLQVFGCHFLRMYVKIYNIGRCSTRLWHIGNSNEKGIVEILFKSVMHFSIAAWRDTC